MTTVGLFTTPFAGVYCSSKSAIHALSDALRMELAPFSIAVVTIQPGGVRSSFGNLRVCWMVCRPGNLG
jgi:short-subunit dehydrogenase